MEVRIQSVVVEFILNHVDVLFSSKLSSVIREGAGHTSLSRPKSLLVSSPSTKLLTLEEAQARTQIQISSPLTSDSKYIEVGDGPTALQGRFHTVIDFPIDRKRTTNKLKKSPVGTWRSFFNLGKSSSVVKRKLHRNPSEPTEMKSMALAAKGDSGTLRSAKSEESLSSLHNVEGESRLYRPRRPRSSSDALSVSFNVGGLPSLNHCNSYDNLPNDESEGEDAILQVPALVSSRMEEVELSPPDMGAAGLDFDPMSFQCSPPRAELLDLDYSPSQVDSSPTGKDKLNGSVRESEFGSVCVTPGSATSSEPASHSPDKVLSPFFSPDLSPTDEKLAKPSSFAEKVVHAFSPKIGCKSPKSPTLTISEPITISVPTHVSEMIGTMAAVSLASSPPRSSPAANNNVSKSPPQMMSMLLKTSDMQLPEGCRQEIHNKLSAAGAASETRAQGLDWYDQTCHHKPAPSAHFQARTKWQSADQHELTNQNKTKPPTHSQAGTKGQSLDWHQSINQSKSASVAHSQVEAKEPSAEWHELTNENKTTLSTQSHATPVESLQEAPAVSSVPLIPPPPPPKSAARLLALALAESAQQATVQSQKKPHAGGQSSGDQHPHNASLTEQCSVPAGSAFPPTSCQVTVQPSVEPQPATGQVPPSTTPGPAASGQVRTAVSPGAPVKQSEPREPEQVSSAVGSSSGCVNRPAAGLDIHCGHQGKARDSGQAPVIHPRAESVPVDQSVYSATPPAPPLRSAESRVPLSHSMSDTITASNFHSFLAATTIPSSIEDALPQPPPPKPPFLCQSHPYHSKLESLPDMDNHFHQKHSHSSKPLMYQCRADSVPQHLSYPSRSESTPQHLHYGSRPVNIPSGTSRFNNFTSQPKAVSVHLPKPRFSRSDYIPGGNPAMWPFVCPHSQFEEPIYPAIRRVHSLHVPSSSIRSVPISRTEVPPDDELYYYQRPIYQYKPCQQPPPPQSDYHVTQLQPYFENGRVQYRYSPYSTSGLNLHGSDCMIYDLADSYGSVRLRQFHSFTSRDIPPYVGRFQGKIFPYPNAHPYPRSGAHVNAMSREHSFVSRDVPPSPDVKLAHVLWDPEEAEKSRFQSIRREVRSRQKTKGLVMSQYDNVSPNLQEEFGGLEVVHSRSKSDPGKTGMVNDGKERWHPATSKTPDLDPQYVRQSPDCELDSGAYLKPSTPHHPPFGNGQIEKPALPQKQSANRTRRPPEADYDQSLYDSCQRSSADSKRGQVYSTHSAVSAGYSSKHRPEHPDSRTYPSATGKYVLSSHEPLQTYEDSFRTAIDRPDLERAKVRGAEGVHLSRGCYSKEVEELAKPLISSQGERGYGTKFQQHPEPLGREQSLSYPYPCLGHPSSKRHSTLTMMSQYDNLDDCHTLAQQQKRGLGGSAPFVPPSYSHPQGRTFTTALGQGSFISTDLALQRSEAEVHVE